MNENQLKRIAARVAVGETGLAELLEQAMGQGWQLVNGLLDISENIYHAIALTKNPDAWTVYKGHRKLDESESYVLYWFFDEEMTQENMAGDLIYSPGSPEDYEEGEEVPEKNVKEFEPYDAGSVMDDVGGSSHEKAVTERVQAILSGQAPSRWEGAPRTDQ